LGLSTNKKVVVSRFDRDTLTGFVNPQTYLTPEGLELLGVGGTLSVIPYEDVKTVQFVRDFGQGEPLDMRQFNSRPKMEGLWVRMRFRDGDSVDGLLANNLLQLETHGFTIVPPDAGFQNQRLFIPKAALSEIQVLAVVGSALRPKKPKKIPGQLDMFEKG
jgi:hypothetical protein